MKHKEKVRNEQLRKRKNKDIIGRATYLVGVIINSSAALSNFRSSQTLENKIKICIKVKLFSICSIFYLSNHYQKYFH